MDTMMGFSCPFRSVVIDYFSPTPLFSINYPVLVFVVLQEKSFSGQSAFQWVRIASLFSPTSFCIHTKRISYSLCSQQERNSISVQSHLQVHRWCIVKKQPRIRKLPGSNVSCWSWGQGHHREHHFCILPRSTSVDWEVWSTSYFHLRQTRWYQFPHHKLSIPE